MADRIVIDPVTRIEGHLRIEAQVDGGKVAAAYSSGTMFRGMELILQGRDPREAWIWAQRICGVCTTVHAHASVYAVEDALGVDIPPNARLIRNLIAGAQHIQDHVIHFYHLHALDWVDVTGALVADPAKTSELAQSISDWPTSSADYFAGVQARVKKIESRGGNAFAEYFVAEAAVSLKQGAGRLIRSETDRGLLVVCDPRLRQMNYGARLRAALPPMAELFDADQVFEWLAALAAAH